jgi:NTE family protein
MQQSGQLNYIHVLSALFFVVFLSLLGGCASRPANDQIKQVDPDSGYRPHLLMQNRKNNDPSTFFALSFSGGGTRAAALSYGVLEELNRYHFPDTPNHRLIDEIDVITGVSGGSFTALSYALYGQRLFEEYETRFLKKNVQSALIRRSLANPKNWFRQASGNFGRSEVAAEYYDEILFEGATFNDLIDNGGPAAIANGTVLSSGGRLAFYQNDFDLLCSDLGTVRLSRAAAASSAVPVALSPVTLNNYGGDCHYESPVWVRDAMAADSGDESATRALHRYREMQMLQDSRNHPYLHLVDGGVADNLGIRGVLEALQELSFSGSFRKQRGYGGINRIVLIVVNAQSKKPNNWDTKESPPNSILQTLQSSSVPISHYTFETVELMKQLVREAEWQRQLDIAEARLAGVSLEEAEARYPKVEMLVFDVSFDAIEDKDTQQYFQGLPTSFTLPDEAVDRLRQVAGELLRQSPVFQEVLGQIGVESLP